VRATLVVMVTMIWFILPSFAKAQAPEPAQVEDQHRSLEMELDEVPGSTGYEVEVTRLLAEGKRKAPQIFKLDTTVWKATLLPGHYEMRIRSFDERHVPGDWTVPRDFIIKLFPPKIISPKDKEGIPSQDDASESVKLEWSPVKRATKYSVTILDTAGKKVFEKIVVDPYVTAKIPVAAEYIWHALPETDDGTEAEASADSHFTVVGKKLETPKIDKVEEVETKLITWKPVTYAKTYKISLQIKNESGEYTEVFKRILISPRLRFKTSLKPGEYHFTVIALADYRADSDIASQDFKSRAYEDEYMHRKSYQTKQPWFVKIAGGPSGFNYQNQSLDLNTFTSFPTQGISGVLSLGTWFTEKSKWGLVGTIESEVVPYLNENNAFNTVGVQVVRKFNFGYSSQIRVYLGALENQFPDVVSDTQGNYYQRITTTFGPSIQLAYYLGLTDNWGLKFSAMISPTIWGQSPTGGGINTKPCGEFNFGLLKNISENLIAGLEYVARDQSVAYSQTNFSSGSNNNGNNNNNGNSIDLKSQSVMFSLQLGF
jgi:hypothetical protein